MKRTRFSPSVYGGTGLYRGRGGFFGGLAGILSGKGYQAGSDMGDKIYDQVGTWGDRLGAALGGGLAKRYPGQGLYRGQGAYAVNNLIMDAGAVASEVVPQFAPTDLHEIVYSNREYIRDIYAPAANTTFALQTVRLNPGLNDTFPWLSQVAINFEEYEIIQLAFTYKSTVSDFASGTGQVGQVVVCTQYNPNSDDFSDKEEMMLYEGGMSCKTTESLIHGVECDPSKNTGSANKFIRAGGLPPTEDLKNYDIGKTAIAVLNCPSGYAGQQLGELWVSYTVKLRKPKLVSANAYNIRRDTFMSLPFTTTTAVPITAASLLVGSRNSFGCQLALASASTGLTTGASTDDLLQDVVTANTASGQLAFTIILPNSYAGIICVRILNYNFTATYSGKIQVVSLSPSTIFRFKDMGNPISSASNTKWSHFVNTSGDNSGFAGLDPRQTDMEMHLRVQPALAGQTNSLQISLSSCVFANEKTAFPRIEVSQYNTFLSTNDNGAADRIDLLTSNGQVGTWA